MAAKDTKKQETPQINLDQLKDMVKKCVEEGICDFKSMVSELDSKVSEFSNFSKIVDPIKSDISNLTNKLNELSKITQEIREQATKAATKVEEAKTKEKPKEEPKEEKAREPKIAESSFPAMEEILERIRNINREIRSISTKVDLMGISSVAEAKPEEQTKKEEAKPQAEPKAEEISAEHVHRTIQEVLECPECREEAQRQLNEAIKQGKIQLADEILDAIRGKTEEVKETEGKQQSEQVEQKAEQKEEKEKEVNYPYAKGRFFELFLKKRYMKKS